MLSHVLRTPLTPIIVTLAILAQRNDLPATVTKAHAMIERNVKLEAHFFDDLVDMPRFSRGKMEIVRVEMDLHEAIERAVEVSAPDLAAKAQPFTVELAATQTRLSGDFPRLQQVLWNLLKNASKFTPEGSAIRLSSRDEPGRIVVEVTDTGIGMDAEVLGRIFNAFEQANVAITRQFGGLGLGLAIAKATVDAHGGQLHASSPGRGQGATFTVSLPLTFSTQAG